jgi:hypothetical protein
MFRPVCFAFSSSLFILTSGMPAQSGERYQHFARNAVQPISVNILDPLTRVSRLPSGRILITDPYYARQHHAAYRHSFERRQHHQTTPYAPPAFYIIGNVSAKNMGKSVKLNHGITPQRNLQTQPKVVFLVMNPGEKTLSVKR